MALCTPCATSAMLVITCLHSETYHAVNTCDARIPHPNTGNNRPGNGNKEEVPDRINTIYGIQDFEFESQKSRKNKGLGSWKSCMISPRRVRKFSDLLIRFKFFGPCADLIL